MKYLNLFITMALLTACSSDEPMQQVVINSTVDFYVVDENGEDLLNPENENAIKNDDITIFYDVEGQTKEFYKASADVPKGFRILEPEGDYTKYWLRLYLNIEEQADLTTTYIQWSDANRDTIQARFDREENSVICTKVWFNDEVAWDVKNPETWNNNPVKDAFFQIVMK